MRLVFLKEAQKDQKEALAWYKAESLELGHRFAEQRKMLLQRIKTAPQHFPFVAQDRQSAFMEVFPYKIIFSRQPEFIFDRCGLPQQPSPGSLGTPFPVAPKHLMYSNQRPSPLHERISPA